MRIFAIVTATETDTRDVIDFPVCRRCVHDALMADGCNYRTYPGKFDERPPILRAHEIKVTEHNRRETCSWCEEIILGDIPANLLRDVTGGGNRFDFA